MSAGVDPGDDDARLDAWIDAHFDDEVFLQLLDGLDAESAPA